MIKVEELKLPKDLSILAKADKTLWLGIPVSGPVVHKYFMFSLVQMFNMQNIIELAELGVAHIVTSLITSFPIDVARNDFIEMALKNGADYLVFFDSDMTFHIDTLPTLLKHKKDVITGLYYGRGVPYTPIFYRWAKDSNFKHFIPIYKHSSSEIFKVDVVGMGCCVMKKEIFFKLNKPYFKYQEDSSSPGRFSVSEDVWFCKQLSQNNIQVWADPNVKCGHLGEIVVDQEMSFAYQKIFEETLKKQYPEKYIRYKKTLEEVN